MTDDATLKDLINPALSGVLTPDTKLDWSDISAKDVPVPQDGKYTPKDLEQMLEKGIALHTRGKTKEAMALYREVLLYDRTNKKALYFSTIALSQMNADETQVLIIMKHAVEQLGNVPEAHYNLGILYHRMGRVSEAKDCFIHAVRLLNRLVEAKTSLAGCYLNLGDKAAGRRWLEEAASTQASQADSVYARGFAKLTLGDLMGGWRDYDRRWETSSFLTENTRDFGRARFWNGKPIPGKCLYIHTEQGAGDIIMFSRFLEEIAKRSQAKTIILEVGANVAPLVSHVKGIDYVIATNTPVPPNPDSPSGDSFRVDYYLPYMTMMQKAGIVSYDKITQASGWLSLTPEYHVAIPPAAPGTLKVGISWAGSKAHKNDRYRSIGWPQFRDLIVADPRFAGKVTWYSLQVGDRAREMDEGGAALGVIDVTALCPTFAETASVISQLDLLICVDTATIHAAGALIAGPPVFTFIPAAPDWRWLLDGETTAWYNDFTLFRQTQHDDWVGPLAAAADRLARNYPLTMKGTAS